MDASGHSAGKVGGRLCATTSEILVNHFKWTKYPKGIAPFGRLIQ